MSTHPKARTLHASDELTDLAAHVSDVLRKPSLRPLVGMPLFAQDVDGILLALGGLRALAMALEEGYLDGAPVPTGVDLFEAALRGEPVGGVSRTSVEADERRARAEYERAERAKLAAAGRNLDAQVKAGPAHALICGCVTDGSAVCPRHESSRRQA